jgi:hypothetical protein
MSRFRTWLGLLTVVLLVGWLVAADTKPGDDKKDPPDPKAKGHLRANWKKLGLSDDQEQKIYKVQGDYHSRIDALEAQVKALKDEEYAKEVEVLTADQKKRLAELDAFKDPTKPDDKKPDDKKDPSKP